jgi:hypothetical protein
LQGTLVNRRTGSGAAQYGFPTGVQPGTYLIQAKTDQQTFTRKALHW